MQAIYPTDTILRIDGDRYKRVQAPVGTACDSCAAKHVCKRIVEHVGPCGNSKWVISTTTVPNEVATYKGVKYIFVKSFGCSKCDLHNRKDLCGELGACAGGVWLKFQNFSAKSGNLLTVREAAELVVSSWSSGCDFDEFQKVISMLDEALKRKD